MLRAMALSKDDLEAIGALVSEKVKAELEPFRKSVDDRFRMAELRDDKFHSDVDQRFSEVMHHVDQRFSEVTDNFEGLYQRDERREQEYLFIAEQLKRIEEHVKRHDQYFDDLDGRVTVLEKKIA